MTGSIAWRRFPRHSFRWPRGSSTSPFRTCASRGGNRVVRDRHGASIGLHEVKKWESASLERFGGINFTLRTTWRDGRLC